MSKMPRLIKFDHKDFRDIIINSIPSRSVTTNRRILPGVWIVFELDDPFFTYLPLSKLWVKSMIPNDPKNEWFVGALDAFKISNESP